MIFTHVIQREDWESYFDLVSQATRGCYVMLEVVGETVGDQIEQNWCLFDELFFDLHSDALIVRTSFNEHAIRAPQGVMIREDGSVRTIGVKDGDGSLRIVHFRDPVLIEGARS